MEKKLLRNYIFWITVLDFTVNHVISVEYYADGIKPVKVNDERFVDSFRTVPWCVTGLDEPEFKHYPLNEFVPFLQRTENFKKPKHGLFEYSIKITEVKLKNDLEKFYSTGRLHNVAHFQFAARKKINWEQATKYRTDPFDIEGLIVQVNFAPYGIGLPTGSFLYPEDLVCSDCTKQLGRPIGCKKKTYLNFMHPTLLVYHHRMETSKREKDVFRKNELEKNFKKFCVGSDKRVTRDATTGEIDISTDCTDTNSCTDPLTCEFPKHYSYCPPATGSGLGLPCTNENDCNGGGGGEAQCIKENTLKMQRNPKEKAEEKTRDRLGKTADVHGSFVWHTHPCHSTRAIRFMIMVVHSFSKGEFYTFKHEAEQQEIAYNLPGVTDDQSVTEKNRNPLFAHSPIFNGFDHICDELPAKLLSDSGMDILHSSDGDIDFAMSKAYDECIRKPGTVESVFCEGIVPRFKSKKFTPPPGCGEPFVKDADPPTITSTSYAAELTSKISKRSCPVCPVLPSTTTEGNSTVTDPPLIKRNFHGAINFITNFCIMPITCFVARFYKETFNLQSIKGVKVWYWMHLFGSGGSSVLMYFGYFSKGFVNDSDTHVVFGNIYIMILAFAYITAWGRHKNHKISAIVEVIHGLCGYSCFGLAIVCMLTVEELSEIIKVFVFTSIGILAVFYIGMEAHICSMDKRFGMAPRRRHFPTVEARFDDLPVPGSKGRKIVLVLLSIVVLLLCLGTVFF